MKNKIFNLFANCKLVKGATRAIIFDLQRGKMYPIPLSLYSILKMQGKSTWNKMIETLKIEDKETIEEYFQFLVDEDLIFFNDNPDLFPNISDEWDEPYELTNCILDFNSIDEQKIDMITKAIGTVRIKALQIRIYKSTSNEKLNFLLNRIMPRGLESIELIMRFSNDINEKELIDICSNNPYIFTITVFDSPSQKYLNNGFNHFGQIFFVTEKINSEKCCGKISPNFFTVNLKTFMEAQKYNSCLNRKISVDTDGNIKNCPSMKESFGHIGHSTFEEILSDTMFSKYWNIHKDLIKTCEQCEFRYVCTDCRAYIDDPDELLSKPLKCGYDPHSGRWSNWVLDTDKIKVMAHYSLSDKN